MARPSARARSPTARAPRAARAAPRARRGGRRPAPASLGDELEAALDVPDLPALGVDRLPQAVGALEVARRARRLALLGEVDDGRRRLGNGRGDPEELQAAPNLVVRALSSPAMENRERLRRVEVVGQGGVELLL